MADIGFAPNYTTLHMIDTAPGEDERDWAYVGPGITNVSPNDSDNTDTFEYYDGGGASNEYVSGKNLGYSVSGDRRYGDKAQDYVRGLRTKTGEDLTTNWKTVEPDGTVTEGEVTVRNIQMGGGDANSKGTVSFEVGFNAMPEETPGDKTKMPESLTLSEASVTVGGTLQLEPSVTPATASAACVYAVKDPSVATVSADGVLKGVKAGTTKLTAKCVAKPSVTKTITVTVSAS